MSTMMPILNTGNSRMLIRHQRRANRGFAVLPVAIRAGGQGVRGFAPRHQQRRNVFLFQNHSLCWRRNSLSDQYLGSRSQPHGLLQMPRGAS